MKLLKGRKTARQYDDMLTTQLRATAVHMEVTREVYEECELVIEALCQGLKISELIPFVQAGRCEGRYAHLYEADSDGPSV